MEFLIIRVNCGSVRSLVSTPFSFQFDPTCRPVDLHDPQGDRSEVLVPSH